MAKPDRHRVRQAKLIGSTMAVGDEIARHRGDELLEERCVWATAVDRLVPPAELAALVDAMAPGPVTVLDVADEFDVDWVTARQACARLG